MLYWKSRSSRLEFHRPGTESWGRAKLELRRSVVSVKEQTEHARRVGLTRTG